MRRRESPTCADLVDGDDVYGNRHGAAAWRGTPAPRRWPSSAGRRCAVRVGAEFFLNRTETADSVARHFRAMKDHGLTIARIFVIWDDVERSPGQWDFRRYDWVYDAAAANGIRIAATLCAEDPPGWTGQTSFYHQRTRPQRPPAAEARRRVPGEGGHPVPQSSGPGLLAADERADVAAVLHRRPPWPDSASGSRGGTARSSS
jgi:hypothetical protein